MASAASGHPVSDHPVSGDAAPGHSVSGHTGSGHSGSGRSESPSVGGGWGLRHVPLMLTSPRRVFRRVEDTGGYGLPLIVLIGLVTLIGFLTVQTGLIDREVDEQTAQRLAEHERTHTDLVDRVRLKESLEAVRKEGEFFKLIARLGEMIVSPLYFLTSFMVVASICYALVALTGRKPEWHTLLSICVLAGFIEVVGRGVRLGMVFFYKSTDVTTSLAPLGEGTASALLGGIDPFRIWFWVLVAIGLTVTRQLGRTMAVVACGVLALVSMGLHAGLNFAATQA